MGGLFGEFYCIRRLPPGCIWLTNDYTIFKLSCHFEIVDHLTRHEVGVLERVELGFGGVGGEVRLERGHGIYSSLA